MYSGITRGLFEVVYIEKSSGLITYAVQFNKTLLNQLEIGASICIDGVCQTVVKINRDDVTFQAMAETLQKTTLNELYIKRKVSVEKSLRYGDVVGGHEMAGHVIGTAEIVAVKSAENNLTLTLCCPKEWFKYIFTKGFISIDGSSLTIGEIHLDACAFTIYLIPETLRVTNFGNKKVGDKVNIELDFKIQAIVKTVERFLSHSN